MTLRALIIDDEAPAREELAHTLSEISDIELVGTCAHAIEGIRTIHAQAPDLVFLDVHMPGLDGFEMLGLIDPEKMPMVVFVTALDDQALRAFEEGAHDYLVKPVRRERLLKAIERVRTRHGDGRPLTSAGPTPPVVRIPCVARGRIRLVSPDRIYGAFTDLTGVHLQTSDGVWDTDLTLRVLEHRLGLFRCHKQHAVSLAAVEELALLDGGRAELTLRGGHIVPVGRRFLKRLRQELGLES